MSGTNGCLSTKHLADLRSSGLNDETIRVAQVYTETDSEVVQRLLGWEFPARSLGPCLVFPFVDAEGNRTPYSRVKPDNPITRDGENKPSKYESPVGQPSHVYLPPRAREVMKSADVSLIYVEGEKKSLALDQHGFAAIGLVGVWGAFKKREEGEEDRILNSDLAEFVLKTECGGKVQGRRVYINFDSDVVANDNSRFAEWETARLLMAQGAEVRVVRLPAKLGGPKVGVDDYLIAHGKSAFEKLLREAARPTKPPLGFSNVAAQVVEQNPDETQNVPRSSAEMAAELVGKSGGWPRNVGGCLVVPDAGGGVRALASHHDLFAFAGSVFDGGGLSRVNWVKWGVTPNVFHAYLLAECERFERAESLPHVPPIKTVFYTRPAPEPDGKCEALSEFLSFFSCATAEDLSLLLACVLTQFWGGPAGKRPAFLFEADENDTEGGRGVGKSTIAQKVAGLVGGAFDIDPTETFSRTRSRLLTPQAGNYRVLLMDNVKTFRLSSADLESLVTNPHINGHRLYHGQAGVPNYYTLFITLNGASLSRDFAQRVIPVRFTRAKFRSSWEAELDMFVNANRERLIADLVGVLCREPGKVARVSRWGIWEAEVLARVPNPDACTELIDTRTCGMDADQEDADRIRETFAWIVAKKLLAGDAHKSRYLLTPAATTKLVEQALNVRMSAGHAVAQLKALGIAELRKSDRKGQRRFLWTGKGWKDPKGKTAAPSTIDYDPAEEVWSYGSTEPDEATVGSSAGGSGSSANEAPRDETPEWLRE